LLLFLFHDISCNIIVQQLIKTKWQAEYRLYRIPNKTHKKNKNTAA